MLSNQGLLPNFFLVGAPKAGTTSLYHYLKQHPEIYMSPVKEPCHFSAEIRPERFCEEMQSGIQSEVQVQKEFLNGSMIGSYFGGLGMEWEEYVRLFKNVKRETAIGDCSVLYLWSETAAKNIRAKIPDAKIIMILRDPVTRIFSEYLRALTSGVLQCSFREFLKSCSSCNRDRLSLFSPVLETGLYYESVKRFLDRFPRENVRIFFYENYFAEQMRILAEIFRFLRVDAGFIPDTSERHLAPRIPRSIAIGNFLKRHGIWQRASRLSPSPFRSLLKKLAIRPRSAVVVSAADRAFLQEYYRDDVVKLSRLLDRDLGSWLQ